MRGAPGSGKTAIAYTCCQELDDKFRLGASFFCSRLVSACKATRNIVPTIAYQLAHFSYPFQSCLGRVLEDNPQVYWDDLDVQFHRLLRRPLLATKEALPDGLVVVIDALDECDNAMDFLRTLIRHAPDLPIRILITSRPEPILNIIKSCGNDIYTACSVLDIDDIDISVVQKDIEKYLAEALAGLSPRSTQIKRLAQLARGSFIRAALYVRYLDPSINASIATSRMRLDTLLNPGEENSRLFQATDERYVADLAAILWSPALSDLEKQYITLILSIFTCLKAPTTVVVLSRLLDLDGVEVVRLLGHLSSVIQLPELMTSEIATINSTSFATFMTSVERSLIFHYDKKQHMHRLACRCLDIMKHNLRYTLCELELSYTLDVKFPELSYQAEKTISPELFHACRHWSGYVGLAAYSGTLVSFVHKFLTHQLLSWMEVLNLKHCIYEGPQMLSQVQEWLQVCSYPAVDLTLIDICGGVGQSCVI